MKRPGGNTLAMLDLLSCAFGGVIVLAIALAAMIDSQAAVATQSYLVIDAWVQPTSSVEVTDEVRRAMRDSILGLELREPNGTATEYLADTNGNLLRQSFDHQPEGLLEPRIGLGFSPDEARSFITLLADRVIGGRYRARLFVAQPPEVDVPLEVAWRIRYPSRSGVGEESGFLQREATQLIQDWQDPSRQGDEFLLDAEFSVEP